jgi:hypothetical protein
LHGIGPVADDLEYALHPLAESGNGVLDRRASVFRLLHAGALDFGEPLLGDVLMRRHPAAVAHRAIDNRNEPPGVLAHGGNRFALADAGTQVRDILIGVAGKAAHLDAMIDQVA